jgi:hypothetical protein
MTKIIFEGNGILSGEHDPEETQRAIEEETRQAAEAEQLEAEQREREAEQGAVLDQIEATFLPLIRDELAAEIADRKISTEMLDAHRADFQRFKASCASWGLPHLPASPQMVSMFLAEELEQGPEHLERLKSAVSKVHQLAEVADPCTDPLVAAVIRLAKKKKNLSPGD